MSVAREPGRPAYVPGQLQPLEPARQDLSDDPPPSLIEPERALVPAAVDRPIPVGWKIGLAFLGGAELAFFVIVVLRVITGPWATTPT